jgi:hypothetical protein
MNVISAPWLDIPEGHYAIIDPRDQGTVTYWRRKNLKAARGTRPDFGPWPLKARYGPVLYTRDVPATLHAEQRREWIRSWYAANFEPYRAAVIEAIAADPVAAGKRFADLTSRCCSCGRTLTDDLSKVYGIGPECRSGLTAEHLALYYAPRLGQAHAEYLAARDDTA